MKATEAAPVSFLSSLKMYNTQFVIKSTMLTLELLSRKKTTKDFYFSEIILLNFLFFKGIKKYT